MKESICINLFIIQCFSIKLQLFLIRIQFMYLLKIKCVGDIAGLKFKEILSTDQYMQWFQNSGCV